MPDFEDDARLTEAFARFRADLAPYLTPPGTPPLRFRLRRRRRFSAAAIAASAVLFIGGPAIGLATADKETPPPLPVGPTVLPPSPTMTATPTVAPTTPSATPSAGPTQTSSKPPTRWYAVQSASGAHTLRQWTGTSSREIIKWELNPPNGAPSGMSDVSIAGGVPYIATCCEPTRGSTGKIIDGRYEAFGIGVRVDARGDLVVATDTEGGYTLQIDGQEVIRVNGVGATDAAVLSDDQIAVLVNPAHFHGSDWQKGSDRPALLLRTREGSRWTSRTVLLDRDYCAVVAVPRGVGLMPAQPSFDPALGPCRAERLDLRNLTTGTTRRLALPSQARGVATDDTGKFILVTRTDGRLSWLTADGDSGTFNGPRGVIFADW